MQERHIGCKSVFGHHCTYHVRARLRADKWSIRVMPKSSIAHLIMRQLDKHGMDGYVGDYKLGAFVNGIESFLNEVEVAGKCRTR